MTRRSASPRVNHVDSPHGLRARSVRLGLGVSLVLLGSVGCAGRGRVDVLESRLREQGDRILALERELEHARSELDIARKQSEAYRQQLAGRGIPIDSPEQADALFRAQGLRINKLRSGGLDQDGIPGDDVLAVSFVPVDAQGDAVKLPGEIEIEVQDPAQPPGQQQIGSWKYAASEAPTHWHSGLFGSGYQLTLPWQRVPAGRELVLIARLTTVDGRMFEDRKQVRVTPPPSGTSDGPELSDSERKPQRSAANTPAAGSASEAAPRLGRTGPAESAAPTGSGVTQARHEEPSRETLPDPNIKPGNWWD